MLGAFVQRGVEPRPRLDEHGIGAGGRRPVGDEHDPGHAGGGSGGGDGVLADREHEAGVGRGVGGGTEQPGFRFGQRPGRDQDGPSHPAESTKLCTAGRRRYGRLLADR